MHRKTRTAWSHPQKVNVGYHYQVLGKEGEMEGGGREEGREVDQWILSQSGARNSALLLHCGIAVNNRERGFLKARTRASRQAYEELGLA